MYRICRSAPPGSLGASHLVTMAVPRRAFAASSVLLQLQHKDRIYGSHGAGFVKHESMSTKDLQNTFARNVTNAAPAADLFRTKVHEGLGTSERDPYTRTLPNQESRAPESSVLRSASVSAPSLDERLRLHTKWGTMQYWLGDQHPRLPVFVEDLLVTDTLPVSPAADRMVKSFATEVIPRLAGDARGPSAQQKLTDLWMRAVQAYGALNTRHLFNKEAFQRELGALHSSYVAEITALTPREDGPLALEVLRRKVVEKRNAFLREGVLPLVRNSPYLGYGDAVWRVFFNSVNTHKAELFSSAISPVHATLGFTWNALMTEDMVRTPAMTAPVALYFLLVAISETHTLAPAELRGASAHLDDGIGGEEVQRLPANSIRLVSPTVKRTFAEKALRELLREIEGCRKLARALRKEGLYDWAREAALCAAMLDNEQLLQADVADAVERFDSATEVKSLLHSLMSGPDDAAKAHVQQVFQLAEGGSASSVKQSIDWDAAMSAVDWPTRWRQLARALLSDPATLMATQKVLKNAVGAKGATKRLFTQEYADELQGVLNRRGDRTVAHDAKIEQLVRNLTSYQQVDRTLEVLREVEVPLDELESAAAAMESQQLVRRQQVDSGVLDMLLETIRQRHPSWGANGVLPVAPASVRANPATWYLECMARIYIRLSYVPQAAAASMAQRTRRRIGAVGLEPTQFNVPAEMGMVEQYDNLQYKRYDWQGWYQRMVDVHNRNVSIRCRIDDLKRLDAYGNPFVELQTERRLRILADDRVGMGVLKLDSDKYEDQSDNITYGSKKVSELLADARKAQLGREYWPTVEVKVRRPSGQSKTYYSVLDDARIESRSVELYSKYREAKKRSLFVTPMDLWLDVKGMQVRKTADTADAQGYTVDTLQDTLGEPAGKA
ncbi:hypothetical protein ABL78_2891 [Leptomonas seymouri]|uniref:Mitochondrial edited mRNA stability factor 1 subunit n=1 Tax=Leptomonas seymouri TaxID=5684 RepID=A0A0N1I6Z6_LEPSE|nr:hypothetical protein ABL78_2891 [Leptomonas seymouri]|eukprot:KPI88015.1 hypothetical protein ABL78_2891 [Leptomonas seymouri]